MSNCRSDESQIPSFAGMAGHNPLTRHDLSRSCPENSSHQTKRFLLIESATDKTPARAMPPPKRAVCGYGVEDNLRAAARQTAVLGRRCRFLRQSMNSTQVSKLSSRMRLAEMPSSLGTFVGDTVGSVTMHSCISRSHFELPGIEMPTFHGLPLVLAERAMKETTGTTIRLPYWIAGVVVFYGLIGLVRPALAATQPPNVLILVADDLGWSDVGYHNPEMRTPAIDKLVQSSVELNCHYVMPMCTPTRVALLTGRYPSRFGNHCTQASNYQALPFGTPTLASVLQEAGYATALIGKWHLGSLPKWGPNLFGFEYSFGSLAGAMAPYDHRYQLNRPEFSRTFHRNHEFIDEPGHITDLTASEAVQWIQREPAEPFFLYVPFHAPHVPLVEEPSWRAINKHIDSADRRLFAAAVSHMDDAVGRIVAALDETGQRENTLIVFFSDNGGLLNHDGDEYPPPDRPLRGISSNAPWRGHKTEPYEGGIRVPAFVSWANQLQPRKIEAPLHAVDWLPTIARLVGASVGSPAEMDGRDIWPILTGTEPNPPPRTLYWVTKEERKWLAVRNGRWKIVRFRDQPWQLFDLEQDRGESNDLATQQPIRLQQLVAIYEREMAKDKLPDDTALLFDGKSLDNWSTLDEKPVTRGWQIVDGMIHLQPTTPRAGHIITKREFGDFRLSFEWKIATGGNSGLKYRVREYDGKIRGCEYQIIDDSGYHKTVASRNSTGALYDLVEPGNQKRLQPLHKFNSSVILVENDQVTHWLNDRKILSVRIGSPDWRRRVAESKFSELTDFALNPSGRIMLTDHGSEVSYRNFALTLLPTSKTSPQQ